MLPCLHELQLYLEAKGRWTVFKVVVDNVQTTESLQIPLCEILELDILNPILATWVMLFTSRSTPFLCNFFEFAWFSAQH